MELLEIKMELPEIILDVNEKTKLLAKKLKTLPDENISFSIAGGCLSNLYMGKDFNDIDIFIEYKKDAPTPELSIFEKIFETNIIPVDYIIDTPYEFIEHPMLYRFSYKGRKVELVFCENLDRIYDFDLRFRQFYLLNDSVMTTREALEDIKNKKLVVSSPCSPLSTFVRLQHFKEELGFSIDKISEDILLFLIDKKDYFADKMLSFIEKKEKLNEVAREKLMEWVKNHTTKVEYGTEIVEYLKIPEIAFPLDDDIRTIMTNNLLHYNGIERNLFGRGFGTWGKNFSKLKIYTSLHSFPPLSVTTDFFDIELSFLNYINDFKLFLQKNRVKIIAEGRVVKKWILFGEGDIVVDSKEYILFYKELFEAIKILPLKDIFELLYSSFVQNTIDIPLDDKKSQFVFDVLTEFEKERKERLQSADFWKNLIGELSIEPFIDIDMEELETFLSGNIRYFSLHKISNGNKKHGLGYYKVTFKEDGIELSPKGDFFSEKFVLETIGDVLKQKVENYFLQKTP